VFEDTEDPIPIDVAIRENRFELWETMWTRLLDIVHLQGLSIIRNGSRSPGHLGRVVYAAYTNLMQLAQNYRFAMSLLDNSKLALLAVAGLWVAIMRLCVHDVRAVLNHASTLFVQRANMSCCLFTLICRPPRCTILFCGKSFCHI